MLSVKLWVLALLCCQCQLGLSETNNDGSLVPAEVKTELLPSSQAYEQYNPRLTRRELPPVVEEVAEALSAIFHKPTTTGYYIPPSTTTGYYIPPTTTTTTTTTTTPTTTTTTPTTTTTTPTTTTTTPTTTTTTTTPTTAAPTPTSGPCAGSACKFAGSPATANPAIANCMTFLSCSADGSSSAVVNCAFSIWCQALCSCVDPRQCPSSPCFSSG